MKTACSILPDRFQDGRHRAIERGLEAAGYRLIRGFRLPESPADILVTWTRHRGGKEELCRRFEAARGRVVIAEEPHLKGSLPPGNERFYALSLGDHQRAWRCGGPERWAAFGLGAAPWRSDPGPGGPIIVRDQRGIGSAVMASPPGWGAATVARLRALTARPVILRPHPKRAPVPALADVLRAAWCLVTWASHEGTEALLAGVPVIWCGPHGFARAGCGTRLEDVVAPPMPERRPAFEALAWSQWRRSEIESGEAFRWLLG